MTYLKLIFHIIILFVFFLLINKNSFALEFEKASENPLSISYIDNYTKQLQADIFKEGDIYKGIFTIKKGNESYYSLGYFESSDGISWQMIKPVLNTGEDLSNARIFKTQTGYLIFITKYEGNTIYKIYSSSCDSDFNCSTNFSSVIVPDIYNNSEKNGVFAGFPYQQDGRTYLFFGAWGSDGFKIKLAYSDDLISWQRCPNDKSFFYGGDGPAVYSLDNDLYVFFHRSDSSGIKFGKTSLPLSCDSVFEEINYVLARSQSYDTKHLIFSSVVNDNGLRLYYSGLGSDFVWRLNLARQSDITPTPTATPVPTDVPSPTESPTPSPTSEKPPIVIIPGLMTSWNREAILHNKSVSYNDWKLLSFVKDYDGLINTLKTIGYRENLNLFTFTYDWRQSIEKTSQDLNNFLQEKIWNEKPNQKINLIGHSLGGLVARIFSQKNINKVSQIISVGSPHQGAVQVYKLLEGGEIDRDNTFLWLAEKIVLLLNKSTLENDRVTVENKFPVAKDLFPIFDFLKDISGNAINRNNMSIKNDWLENYDANFSDIFPIFTAIYGEKDNKTPSGYITEPPNLVNQILGNYFDGEPELSLYDFGDYTVLSDSANQDNDSVKLDFDHEEIITKKEAIKKILETLNINFNEDQITEGQKTIISPSLIFMIKSPATMQIEFNSNTYDEEEGIIFIPNAQSGDYTLNVKGTDQGQYEIEVGQISENNEVWEKIYGEITLSPPSSQIDNYFISYNNETAYSNFPDPTLTPALTATPTVIPTLTLIPTLTPTQVPTLTSGNNSTNSSTPTPTVISQSIFTPTDKPLFSTNQKPEVLGVKNEPTKKNSSNYSVIMYLIITAAGGLIGYLIKIKFFNDKEV